MTVICGTNAQGKTSLLEAVGWAATGKSFRGVPDSALVRSGHETAILRAEVVDDERVQLLEAEIKASGRNRVQLNRNPVQRSRDLLGLMRVTVFAPDDLQLVKGGPVGAARLPRRPPGGAVAPVRGRPRRLRAGAPAAQRPAARRPAW